MLYSFHLPTKIIFGAGAVAQVGAEAKQIGAKALVVTYPDMRRLGVLDRVLAGLKTSGVEGVVFEKVEPNPRLSTVEEAAGLAGRSALSGWRVARGALWLTIEGTAG